MRKLKLEELGRETIEVFSKKEKLPITVILDNIRSAMNVGSVFRTCDAFAIERIILCGISAQPPHREILKTAIGASMTVEWRYEEHVLQAVQQLREDGYMIIGIEQTTESLPLQEFRVDTTVSYAICLGNEVEGLSDNILPQLHYALEIPQFGTKHSLNVSVCTGIVLWHFMTAFK